MLEFSKKFGLCLGIAAAFCFGACDDDSGSDKGKTNSGSDATAEECSSDDDCKDVEGKPVCDQDKKECVEKKEDGGEGSGEGEGGDGGSSEGGETKCEGDEQLCDKTCVDLTKDSNHCGNCETACTDGKACIDSKCDFVCDNEEQPNKCDDGCVNFKTDKNHCGDCSTKCEGEQACNDGKCGLACNEGETQCGESCINTQTDKENCGKCGEKCSDGETCQSGECKQSCEAGQELCETGCINLDSDTSCGTCDSHISCNTDAGEKCSASRTCEGPCPDSDKPNLCGEVCVNLKTDPQHCGGCEGEEHVCGEKEACSDGKCVTKCDNDYVEFEGACISKTDPKHCGIGVRDESIPEGGIDCTALAGIKDEESVSCENDKCKISACADGYAICGGDDSKCVSLSSVEACGSCENACKDENADPDKTTCQYNSEKPEASVCQLTCKDGMTSCGGKCLDLSSNKDNCGWCDNKCGSDAECKNGFCTIDASKCDENGYVTTTVGENTVKAYCIGTEAEFRDFRDAINKGQAYPDANNKSNAYILMDDLVLGEENAWISIGNQSKPFNKGTFIGNGKSISGTLTTNYNNAGLFGYATNSVFDGMNIKITYTSTGSTSNTGALVGYASNSVISHSRASGTHKAYYRHGGYVGYGSTVNFDHCTFEGTITATTGDNGAFIGAGSGTFRYCDVKVDLSCPHHCGGFGGSGTFNIYNSVMQGSVTCSGSQIGGFCGNNCGTVQDSIQKAAVTGAQYVGGLGGSCGTAVKNVIVEGDVKCTSSYCGGLCGSSAASITDSHSTGKVSSSSSYVGGLIGSYTGKTFSGNYATGAIEGRSYTGGIIGYANNAKVENSYATGEVSSTDSSDAYVGGLIGFAYGTTINNVYAKGNVKGGTEVGGLVGNLNGACTVTNAAAFGNATCIQVGTTRGSYAGGLFGTARNGNNVSDSFATGDSKAGRGVGSITGWIGNYTTNFRNVYGAGKVDGTSYVGALAGELTTSNINFSIKNSYYWEGNGKDVVVGNSKPAESSAYPFKFNKDNAAVLSQNEARTLASSLGKTWITATCKLTSGPNSEVTIPVPKTLGADICK